MIAWPAKDPADVADYTWTPGLDAGDTIISFSATVTGGTITQPISSSFTDAVGRVWVEGGAFDEIAMIALVVVTNGGRTFKDCAALPVIDRASELLATFRLRYPAFAGVDDGRISYWLAQSGASVGDWSVDTLPAKAALAAHGLAQSGALAGAVPAGLTSFRSGDFSATVSDSIASRTGYDATIYGREFAMLRRRNCGGPRLAWSPPASVCNV